MNFTTQHILSHRSTGYVAGVSGMLQLVGSGIVSMPLSATLITRGNFPGLRQEARPASEATATVNEKRTLVYRDIRAVAQSLRGLLVSCW